MKYIKKISTVLCAAALGIATMTSCEGGDIISVNSPSWLQEKIDSIAEAKKAIVLSPEPSTLGSEDCSAGWWGAHLAEDITLEPGKVYTVPFINYSSLDNIYNNYVIVLRDGKREANGDTSSGGVEYAVLRADNFGWGTSWDKCVHSATIADKKVEEKVGGDSGDFVSVASSKDWLSEMNGASCVATFTVNYTTVDVEIIVNGTAGTVSSQKYSSISFDSSKPLTLDFTVDHSCIKFGATSQDYQPLSLDLKGVPETVDLGTPLDSIISKISATVTFEGGMTKTVDGTNLTVSVVPDLETPGDKYLVATYNKTFLGKTSKSAVPDHAQFNVVSGIKSISVTTMPTRKTYYFYKSAALNGVERTLAFDPTDMVVTAKYVEGDDAVVDNSKLKFSSVPATVGEHEVTITTENGRTATVKVNVAESAVTPVTPTPTKLGNEDNSAAWWSVFTDDMNVPAGKTYKYEFTNYSNLKAKWNNFSIILRKQDKKEYGVFRADDYGWRYGTEIADLPIQHGNSSAEESVWCKAMNGAKCTAYITNNNNGMADIQIVMNGSDSKTYIQYYLGIDTVDPSDLNVSFTLEGSHLVFQ